MSHNKRYSWQERETLEGDSHDCHSTKQQDTLLPLSVIQFKAKKKAQEEDEDDEFIAGIITFVVCCVSSNVVYFFSLE